jgi:hypothetical protein
VKLDATQQQGSAELGRQGAVKALLQNTAFPAQVGGAHVCNNNNNKNNNLRVLACDTVLAMLLCLFMDLHI